MTEITAIITAHREGLLAGPALASFRGAITHARSAGTKVDALVVLDRADQLTRSVFARGILPEAQLLETDLGDPGAARNAAVAAAAGSFVAFLDADDLWGENWLTEAYARARAQTHPTVWHSEANIVFGAAQQIWFHVDSEALDFELDYMRVGNYWDAMCFTDRDLLQHIPFQRNDLVHGFGHEDWHWNCSTLAYGVPHRPVPGTVHFKRRRRGSQMMKCEENDVVIPPSPLERFSWAPVSLAPPVAATNVELGRKKKQARHQRDGYSPDSR